MSSPSLHIVAFDVPFPADYGGAIDVYYRVKALHELGVKIILHCYEYGRGEAKKLEEITEKVYYYSRKKRLIDLFSNRPFIVQTRRSNELLARLLNDDFPILFEGLHTTYFLGNIKLKKRIKIVRAHNIEHHYYGHLAANATGFKKRFFAREARKLEKYEAALNDADHILAINLNDLSHFSHYKPKVHLLHACFDVWKSFTQTSTKPYALFHGNLSVSENSISAKWLIQEVFSNSSAQLIVAGKNPPSELTNLQNDHVKVIANPTATEMNELISNARVHALHTDQATGVKLKLIQSLQTSGHVIVNPRMVNGTILENHCVIVNTAKEWKSEIETALNSELSEEDLSKREALFNHELDTVRNCNVIVRLISCE